MWQLRLPTTWPDLHWDRIGDVPPLPSAGVVPEVINFGKLLPHLDWLLWSIVDCGGNCRRLVALDLSTSPFAWREVPLDVGPSDDGWSPNESFVALPTGRIAYVGQSGATGELWALYCSPPATPTPTPTDTPTLTATATPTDTATPIPLAQRPELAISSLSWDIPGATTCAPAGAAPELTVCVRNDGGGRAPRFAVRSDSNVRWMSPGLGAGHELCLEPKSGAVGRVVVDPDGAVQEVDEANNAAVVAAPTPMPTCAPPPRAGGRTRR